MNNYIATGNLTREPELKFTPSGVAIANLGLAINEKRKGKDGNMVEDTVFLDATAFGRTAEVIGERMHKGSPILIHGRLSLDQWDDKKTGEKRTKLKVLVDRFEFMDKGGKREGDQQRPARQVAPAASTEGAPLDDSDPAPF